MLLGLIFLAYDFASQQIKKPHASYILIKVKVYKRAQLKRHVISNELTPSRRIAAEQCPVSSVLCTTFELE